MSETLQPIRIQHSMHTATERIMYHTGSFNGSENPQEFAWFTELQSILHCSFTAVKQYQGYLSFTLLQFEQNKGFSSNLCVKQTNERRSKKGSQVAVHNGSPTAARLVSLPTKKKRPDQSTPDTNANMNTAFAI